jgi:hypothetical protein
MGADEGSDIGTAILGRAHLFKSAAPGQTGFACLMAKGVPKRVIKPPQNVVYSINDCLCAIADADTK